MDLYGSMVSRSLCVCISKVRWFCFPFGMLSWAPRWWWMRRTNPSLRVVGASHFRRGVVDFLSLVPCGFLKTEVKMMRITRRSWKRGNGLSSGWVFSYGCQLWEVFFLSRGCFFGWVWQPFTWKGQSAKERNPFIIIHHYSQLETLGWTLQTLRKAMAWWIQLRPNIRQEVMEARLEVDHEDSTLGLCPVNLVVSSRSAFRLRAQNLWFQKGC